MRLQALKARAKNKVNRVPVDMMETIPFPEHEAQAVSRFFFGVCVCDTCLLFLQALVRQAQAVSEEQACGHCFLHLPSS